MHTTVRPLLTCAALAALTVIASAAPALSAPVSCGQTADGDATLVESCTGDVVVRSGRLDLAGHTVRGTIYCEAPACEIVSRPRGGAVVGFGVPLSVGITAGGGAVEGAGNLIIDGVDVRGFGTGIAALNVVMTNVRVSGNLWRGVDALESIEAVGAAVRRNGEDGLHARIGGVAVDGGDVAYNGGSGVRALAGVIAVDSTIEDNTRDGIENYSQAALVVDSRVRLNGRHGVRSDDSDCDPSDVLELRGSDVSGNAAGEGCGASPCADLVACTQPTLDEASSCGTSLVMESIEGENWAACTND